MACATVGAVTYVSLHSYLLGQLDQQLGRRARGTRPAWAIRRRAATATATTSRGRRRSSPYNCAQQQQQQTFTAQVRHGVLTENHISNGTCPLSHADKAVLTAYPVGRQPFTSDLSSLGDYRLLAVQDRSEPASPTSPACR